MTPTSDPRHEPEEHEPIAEQTTGDAVDFIDKTVAEITDTEVDEHLHRVLSRVVSGRRHAAFSFDRVNNIMLSTFQKEAADAAAEQLQIARDAAMVAREQAEEILADARRQAAETAAQLINDAREQAEQIIADARAEAERIRASATLRVMTDQAEATNWYERAARDWDSRTKAALGADRAPGAVLARSDLFAFGALADDVGHGDHDHVGHQSPRRIFVSYSRDADLDSRWLPPSTRSDPVVMYLAGQGRCPSPREEGPPVLWEGLPVLLTEGPKEASYLIYLLTIHKAWQRLRAAETAMGSCPIMGPHHCGENAIPDDRCHFLAKKLVTWFSRERGATVDLARHVHDFDFAVLADSGVISASRRGVVPWPSRRMVSGTVAGHVMIPYVAVPVLARSMTVDAALGEMLQSGESALPVGEGSAVAGVITLADLARSVRDSRGVPSIQRIEALMQPPAEVTIDTPLPAVRAAMSGDDADLVIVRGPGGGVVGYITASSLLADAVPDEDDSNRRRPRMEVPLLGAGGGTARICVPV